MVKVSDLRAGQGNVEVEGVISEIGDTRVFNKYGRELKVANAIFKDDSGAIKLTLWNDDVARFKEGDKIKIINGYVSEFQGEKQLTSGKFGRMEKTGESSEAAGSTSMLKENKKESVSKRAVKKKNEESLDEYSEGADEEPTEEEEMSEDSF